MKVALTLALLAGCAASGGDDEVCDPAVQQCTGGGNGGSGGDGCMTPDADGDGWSDEVELAMETSVSDATDNPTARGELAFVMPYQALPRPASHEVETTAKLSRADVAILLDTTGSMAGTVVRIQGELAEIVQLLAGEIDDLAFGVAGFGDFPVYDGANSHHDVPFYLTHRAMTARTPAGMTSVRNAFQYKSILDGLGGWFSQMRGGDEPEQHWEALRQAATGVGITYPDPYGNGTRSTKPFTAQTALPSSVPAGEEVGTIGGFGFRRDSTPIIIQITDTNAHVGGLTTTSPVSATRPVALAALRAIGARVVGIMAWITVGHDDLTDIVIDTGGVVPPTAWGTGTARPANCPIGKCCVVAEDEWAQTQPDPINGQCTLVFKADRYSMNLGKMVAQGVIAVARGAKFAIGTTFRDGTDDVVDTAQFVENIEAVAGGACAGASVTDTNGDGTPDTFSALVGDSAACFRITVRPNTTVAAGTSATRYRATLQLTGDGVASFSSREVSFVVPSAACAPPVLL